MGIFSEIKTLLALRDFFENIKGANTMNTTPVKPGWQTTEFWGKVAVQVFMLFGAAKGFLSPDKAALIAAVLESVYGIARSVVKYKGGTLPDVPGDTTVSTVTNVTPAK
jgi:hypothetical protein